MTASAMQLLLAEQFNARPPFREAEIDENDPAIRILTFPFALNAGSIPAQIEQVDARGRPDLMVLTERHAENLLASRLPASLAAILPLVDASGAPARDGTADLRIPAATHAALSDVVASLRQQIDRVRALPQAVLWSSDPKLQLLARLHVRGGSLCPRRDPTARETILFSEDQLIPGVRAHAEALVERGLLAREFFDRILCCPACDSARIVVREQCASCGSANIVEEPILHHLRCAYQGPERDFRCGGDLTCPKCRLHLEHFSVDYDRPGFLSICVRCDHASSHTATGFACLDCMVENGADHLDARAVHAYRLTPAGEAAVRRGEPLGEAAPTANTAMNRIRDFAAAQARNAVPCAILAVKVAPTDPSWPKSQMARTHALCGALLRELFTPDTDIIEAGPFFFALLVNDREEDVQAALPEIRASIERFLSPVPMMKFRAYGPDAVLDSAGAH